MKCFVCGDSNINVKYKPLLGMRYVCICSQECYAIYCKEYSLTKLEVTVEEMEERIKDYRKKKEVNRK